MEYPRICYITSDEPFLVKERLNKMKTAFISEYMDINFKEITSGQLRTEIETVPFFAEKKMLLLDTADNEETAEALTNVSDFCSIIIINKLDKRKKLYKTIQKVGEIIELTPYNENQMINWIIETGSKMGVKIPKNAAKRMVEICGLSDMHFTYNEIIKLVSTGDEITVDLVNKVVSRTPEYNSFILTDAISKKDKQEAYQIIKVLAEKNEYLPMVLSMVNRNFAVLRMIKTMKDGEIKEAGIHPYTIKLLKPHAQNYTVEQLDKLMEICQQIDFDMKNGANHRIALEKIIGVI
jgi:DNA polymerase-3 subunit delta